MALAELSQIIKPNFENITSELKIQRRWVLWKAEKRGDVFSKVPVQIGGAYAKSNDPGTWASFNEVKEAYEAGEGDGIGFMLGGGYIGIDIDNAIRPRKTPSDLATELIQTVDSFYEKSVSGTGVHIICKGSIPEGYKRKNTDLDIEIYSENRFFTTTGKTGEVKPVNEDQDGLNKILNKYFKEKQSTEEPGRTGSSDLSKEQVLQRMFNSKNGSAAQSLYSGDTSAYNDDHSAADLAFCNILAFWTNNDPVMMDQIFRESGLMRYEPEGKHWDRKTGSSTYGALTIQKAIQDTHRTIQDYQIEQTADDFSITIADQEDESGQVLVLPHGYRVEESGVLKMEKVDNRKKDPEMVLVTISRVAPYLIKEYQNIEEPQIFYELQWRNRGRIVSEVVPARVISESKSIIELSDKGLPVNTNNAGELIRYFDRFLGANELPLFDAVERLGHVKGQFIHPETADVNIIALDQGEEQVKKAISTRGTLDEWKKNVWDRISDQPVAVFYTMASFASILVEPLRQDPFIVDLASQTSRGKTTALRVAASVWGSGKLVNEFNSTAVSIERKAAFLNSFPLFLDDSRKAEDSLLKSFVYRFSGGTSKGRGSVQGSQKSYSWRNILLSTGEVSLLDHEAVSNKGGTAGRVIPLNMDPLKRDLDNVIALNHSVEDYYGSAGVAFVELLQNYEGDIQKEYTLLRNHYASNSRGNEVLARISAGYALIHLAGQMLNHIGLKVDLEATEKLFERMADENKAVDKPMQMLEEVLKTLDSSRHNIIYDDEYSKPITTDAIYKNGQLYILPSFLDRILLSESPMIRKEWLKRGISTGGKRRGKAVDYKNVFINRQSYKVIPINMSLVLEVGYDFQRSDYPTNTDSE